MQKIKCKDCIFYVEMSSAEEESGQKFCLHFSEKIEGENEEHECDAFQPKQKGRL